MYKIEIPKIIHQICTIFYRLGFWDMQDGTLHCARKYFYFLYFVTFIVSVVVGARPSLSNNMEECIFSIVVSIMAAVQLCRMAYIIRKENETLSMINEIGTHNTDNPGELAHVNNKLKNLMKFSKYFVLMLAVAYTFLTIFPIVSGRKMLIFNIGFPLDWKNSQISFWITYLYFEAGVFLSLICYLFAVLLWYLMMNCAIKYEILGNQFRNLGVMDTHQENLLQRDFIVAIEEYTKINQHLSKFAKTFSNLFFFQIVTSSTCICGSVYVLGYSSHENVIQDAFSCCAIIFSLFDIFMVMYFGNEIKLSSDMLCYCLFKSNWIEQTQSYKKYIIIMSEVLKRPQELKIATLYPMNLETFTSIVNWAYSMFNILRNMNFENN